MDRGAWPFFVGGVICWVDSVSVCGETREERRDKMKKKRENARVNERKDEREDREIRENEER